jgi:hypothetical protein
MSVKRKMPKFQKFMSNFFSNMFCTNEADLLDVGEAEDAEVACRQEGGGGGRGWREGEGGMGERI